MHPRSFVRRHPSGALIATLTLVWFVTAAVSPPALLSVLTRGSAEGPLEWLEALLVVGLLAGWLLLGWRYRARPALRWFSLLMVLQLILVLGEELDWGLELGLHRTGARNLRMVARELGWDWFQAAATVPVLLGLIAAPLLPSARVRAWLGRLHPVRATVGDALAGLVALPAHFVIKWTFEHRLHTEYLQLTVYLVVAVITFRALMGDPTGGGTPRDAVVEPAGGDRARLHTAPRQHVEPHDML